MARVKVLEKGHIYELPNLDGNGIQKIEFVNREDGTEHEGIQSQQLLAVLIDRTRHCDDCLRWEGNDQIIHHLRMALVLHEARALLRKTEKGQLKPEEINVGEDGHFIVLKQPQAKNDS